MRTQQKNKGQVCEAGEQLSSTGKTWGDHETMTSRRKFLAGTGLLVLGAALKIKGAPATDHASSPVIDIHQHADYNGRSVESLLHHQRAMGVTASIVLPVGRQALALPPGSAAKGGRPIAGDNDACYRIAKEYPKTFYAGASELDFPDAAPEIEKYLKLGAVVIGELKAKVECDSAEMQQVYQLAQSYDVPVLMHWQYGEFNLGLERFHKMLEKYPRVNFIGHAQTWWANIDKENKDQTEMYPKGKVFAGGLTDRLLSDYPNMYGDLSSNSGLNALTRDEEHIRQFLTRHQDKLMFGSDCADTDGSIDACLGAKIIASVRRLSATKKIERKVLYENAKKLFRIG